MPGAGPAPLGPPPLLARGQRGGPQAGETGADGAAGGARAEEPGDGLKHKQQPGAGVALIQDGRDRQAHKHEARAVPQQHQEGVLQPRPRKVRRARRDHREVGAVPAALNQPAVGAQLRQPAPLLQERFPA